MRYLITHDNVERTRMARGKTVFAAALVLTLLVIAEDAVFFLVLGGRDWTLGPIVVSAEHREGVRAPLAAKDRVRKPPDPHTRFLEERLRNQIVGHLAFDQVENKQDDYHPGNPKIGERQRRRAGRVEQHATTRCARVRLEGHAHERTARR